MGFVTSDVISKIDDDEIVGFYSRPLGKLNVLYYFILPFLSIGVVGIGSFWAGLVRH